MQLRSFAVRYNLIGNYLRLLLLYYVQCSPRRNLSPSSSRRVVDSCLHETKPVIILFFYLPKLQKLYFILNVRKTYNVLTTQLQASIIVDKNGRVIRLVVTGNKLLSNHVSRYKVLVKFVISYILNHEFPNYRCIIFRENNNSCVCLVYQKNIIL